MKLATIAPTKSLYHLVGEGYLFALGQELYKSEEYYTWHMDAARGGRFIIVDNGAAEPEDEREQFPTVAHASLGIYADEIILPDKIRDATWTLEHSLDGDVLRIVPRHKRFVVPQGSNWHEWKDCLRTLMAIAQPVTIGIAKWIDGGVPYGLPGGRPKALEIIRELGLHHECNIHLLGVYARPFEEVSAAVKVIPSIRGIDTGAPIAYAQQGAEISDDEHYSLQWNAEVHYTLAMENINRFRDHCWSAAYAMGGQL